MQSNLLFDLKFVLNEIMQHILKTFKIFWNTKLSFLVYTSNAALWHLVFKVAAYMSNVIIIINHTSRVMTSLLQQAAKRFSIVW